MKMKKLFFALSLLLIVSALLSCAAKDSFSLSIEAGGETLFSDDSADVRQGENLIQILEELLNKEAITLEIENGSFVRSISGYENNDEAGWIYYVNDEMPLVGANEYIPAKGDVIEFVYAAYADLF